MQLYGFSGLLRLATRVAVSRLLRTRFHLAVAPPVTSPFHKSAGHTTFRVRRSVIQMRPNSCDGLKRAVPISLSRSACPFILKPSVLRQPRLGCINIHHAPLPRYKGMMPTFWQLYQGERHVGLTIHSMTEKIDEGTALLQSSLVVEPGETLDHLIRRSKRQAAHCLADVLRGIDSESVEARPLNQEPGSYFTFPTLAEIRQFHKRGLRAI